MRWVRTYLVVLIVGLLASCDMRRPAPTPPPARPDLTLLDAARGGDVELATTLILQGVDVDEADAEGLAPLHIAALAGRTQIIRLLVSAGATVDARDGKGSTPLHGAVQNGTLAAVEALVEGGADANARNEEGATPVQIALLTQRQDIADYLLAHGAVDETIPETPEVDAPRSTRVRTTVLSGETFRDWTSASGSRITAEFVQCVMDRVTLRRNDGELVRIQINQLSPADQVAVRQLSLALPPVLSRQRAERAVKPRSSIGERIGDEKGWDVLTDCRLLRGGANDGDSFHVLANGKEYIFRLYYVDAAETSLSYPDRVEEQGRYFKLGTKDVLRLGSEAKAFTERVLSRGAFTVVTKWEDARGNSSLSREYAFVITDQGDLDELLMAEGLVRLYGMRIDGPFGARKHNELKDLEREAKREQAGAWGLGKEAARASPAADR